MKIIATAEIHHTDINSGPKRKTDIEVSQDRADTVLRARRIAGMMVTESKGDPDENPEKILLDFAAMSPKEMLAAYEKYMADYSTLPLDPAGDRVRLYRGEWSILSGFPGTGKTTMLRQMCCHLLKSLKSGESVFCATLEQDPSWFIIEMAATAAGVETPTEAHITAFIDTYGSKLKVWGVIGMADHKKILATIRDLADNHGCRHAIIDSLMALDVPSNDNEAQRHFANLVSATARAKGVHIYLVAHPKKPVAADQEPNIWDVAGSSDLGRLSFNVWFIRRGPEIIGMNGVSSMLFHVLKQRTRGMTGEQMGFFYRHHRQFHVDQYATSPTRYLDESMYPSDGLTDDLPEHIMNPSSFRIND